MENENQTKTGNKSKLIIAILIIVIILIGAIFYYKSATSANNIFTSQINKYIDNAQSKEQYDTLNSTVKLSTNVKPEDEQYQTIADYLNTAKITINSQTDYKNKTQYIGLDVDYQNADLLKGNVYYSGDDSKNLYVFVNDLFDKYFKVDLSSIDENGEITDGLNSMFIPNVDNSKIDKVNDILKNEINNQLKEEYFSQEDVDGMKKSTLKLTVNQLKEMCTVMLNNLQNNEEFLNCYNDKEKVKEAFSKLVDALNEAEDKDLDIEISLYTTGLLSNKFEKMEIAFSNDSDSVQLNINKIEDNNYEFYANISTTENNMKANVETLNGSLKIEEVDSNNKKAVFTISVPDLGIVTLNVDISTEINGKLEEVDTSKSVDVNKLSDDEAMEIYTNLQKMPIYQLISLFSE